MIYQSFRLRGPPFEGVAVHTPQHRGHTFVPKNCFAYFGKNRKSVTKAQQHQNMSIIMCTYGASRHALGHLDAHSFPPRRLQVMQNT